MKFSAVKAKLPSLSNACLAVFSAILLILAFPDFELWFLAYVALAPLLFAIERQKESLTQSFLTGWIFGTVFIFGSCWWLTYSLIRYGGIPIPVAYFLLLGAAITVGTFFAVFAASLSKIIKSFGAWGILSAPFLWMALEFVRYYLTANNWNSIAYSQAFQLNLIQSAQLGGIYLIGLFVVGVNSVLALLLAKRGISEIKASLAIVLGVVLITAYYGYDYDGKERSPSVSTSVVAAIQPNVPMSGLKYEVWMKLRQRHIELAETALSQAPQSYGAVGETKDLPKIVIFPESPMNFSFTEDREFQEVLRAFAQRNNVSVLFNAAEPAENGGYYNAAVMVNEEGRKIVEYDKIHLVPFGEYVPLPKFIASSIPTVAGNFEFGKNYNLMPFGEAKAGVMICFESHFPTLSRRFVNDGADILVEMTNDGYLGPTPVLRQHLASTVFRAVETNRPVLRTTNVGITAYVTEYGEVIEPSQSYTEETRLWTVSKSDGSRTFYVKYGDWAAWMSVIVSLGLLVLSFRKKKVTRDTNL